FSIKNYPKIRWAQPSPLLGRMVASQSDPCLFGAYAALSLRSSPLLSLASVPSLRSEARSRREKKGNQGVPAFLKKDGRVRRGAFTQRSLLRLPPCLKERQAGRHP